MERFADTKLKRALLRFAIYFPIFFTLRLFHVGLILYLIVFFAVRQLPLFKNNINKNKEAELIETFR